MKPVTAEGNRVIQSQQGAGYAVPLSQQRDPSPHGPRLRETARTAESPVLGLCRVEDYAELTVSFLFRRLHTVKYSAYLLSEGFEEGEYFVGWPVAAWGGSWRCSPGQCLFLESKVGVDVNLGRGN